MDQQVLFHIPAWVEQGILTDELRRIGGIVRDTQTGQIVMHLQEVARATSPAAARAKALRQALTRPRGLLALGAGAVAGAGTVAFVSLRRSRIGRSYTSRFIDSLTAYLQAGQAGALDREVIDQLVGDRDALVEWTSAHGFQPEGAEQIAESLDADVLDFTQRLAATHGVDADELLGEEPLDESPLSRLRRNLIAQRAILDAAA